MSRSMHSVPLPPTELALRVGVLDREDPLSSFDGLGARLRDILLELQPAGWFEDKRILDFGCGAGKVLRHFLDEAERCEFFGCDIDEPSIRWLEENLSPPLKVFVCSEAPPLQVPGEHFDLVWAMSVFTHITEYWADWLLEMHRVLRPGGRLVATFLGKGMSESIAGEPWDPDRIGMNVRNMWQAWEHGGPSVQHSEWWLREHWGRAFDIERLHDSPRFGHGVIVLTKRPVSLTREDLLAPAPDDPRELAALAHNVETLVRETIAVGTDRDAVRRLLDTVHADRNAQVVHVEALHRIEISRSWRLTAPLRATAARVRAWRRHR